MAILFEIIKSDDPQLTEFLVKHQVIDYSQIFELLEQSLLKADKPNSDHKNNTTKWPLAFLKHLLLQSEGKLLIERHALIWLHSVIDNNSLSGIKGEKEKCELIGLLSKQLGDSFRFIANQAIHPDSLLYPLTKACLQGSVFIVQTLLEAGVSVVPDFRQTPLMPVTKESRLHPSVTGDTPLHIAVRNRHPALVETLLKYKADTFALNSKYLTPLDLILPVHPFQGNDESELKSAFDENTSKIIAQLQAANGSSAADDARIQAPLCDAIRLIRDLESQCATSLKKSEQLTALYKRVSVLADSVIKSHSTLAGFEAMLKHYADPKVKEYIVAQAQQKHKKVLWELWNRQTRDYWKSWGFKEPKLTATEASTLDRKVEIERVSASTSAERKSEIDTASSSMANSMESVASSRALANESAPSLITPATKSEKKSEAEIAAHIIHHQRKLRTRPLPPPRVEKLGPYSLTIQDFTRIDDYKLMVHTTSGYTELLNDTLTQIDKFGSPAFMKKTPFFSTALVDKDTPAPVMQHQSRLPDATHTQLLPISLILIPAVGAVYKAFPADIGSVCGKISDATRKEFLDEIILKEKNGDLCEFYAQRATDGLVFDDIEAKLAWENKATAEKVGDLMTKSEMPKTVAADVPKTAAAIVERALASTSEAKTEKEHETVAAAAGGSTKTHKGKVTREKLFIFDWRDTTKIAELSQKYKACSWDTLGIIPSLTPKSVLDQCTSGYHNEVIVTGDPKNNVVGILIELDRLEGLKKSLISNHDKPEKTRDALESIKVLAEAQARNPNLTFILVDTVNPTKTFPLIPMTQECPEFGGFGQFGKLPLSEQFSRVNGYYLKHSKRLSFYLFRQNRLLNATKTLAAKTSFTPYQTHLQTELSKNTEELSTFLERNDKIRQLCIGISDCLKR